MLSADLIQIDKSEDPIKYIVVFHDETRKVVVPFSGSNILARVRAYAKQVPIQTDEDKALVLGPIDLTDPAPKPVPVEVQARLDWLRDYSRLLRFAASPLGAVTAEVDALKADLESRFKSEYLDAL